MAENPQVPRFQDLTFIGAAERFDELVNALAEQAEGPWSRDLDREALSVQHGNEGRAAFHRSQSDEIPELHLFLAVEDNSVTVPNIIPTGRSLTEREYNAALQDFARVLAVPVASGLDLTVDVSEPYLALEDALPAAVFEALIRFSRTANRSTGSAHPDDRDRWFEFLTLLHRSGQNIETDVLARWLHLDGWREDVAWDLAIEFEFAMGLLRHVDLT